VVAITKSGRPYRQENGDKRIEPFFCPHSFVDWIGPVNRTWRAEGFSVAAVTPSKARKRHRESLDNRRESLRSSSLRLSHLWRCFMAWATGLELGGEAGSRTGGGSAEAPQRLGSGARPGSLRGVFRKPEGTTASGWNDAEVNRAEFWTLASSPP